MMSTPKPAAAGAGSSNDDADKRQLFFEEVADLNRSFYEWVVRQFADRPFSVWRAGLMDYIKFTEKLEQEYGPLSTFFSPSRSATNGAAASAPTPTPTPASTPAAVSAPAPTAASAAAPAAGAPAASAGGDDNGAGDSSELMFSSNARVQRFCHEADTNDWADMGIGVINVRNNHSVGR